MRRREISRGVLLPLLAALLLSGPAYAQREVPDWAEGWKKTWLQAYEEGTLKLSAKVIPHFLGNTRQDVFAVLELRSLDFPTGDTSPASVVIVIDRSASTAGRRLLITQKAALQVIDGMSPKDHLSIIRVSDKPDLLPIEPLTDEAREKMNARVSQMQAVGRSDLSAGLEDAIEELTKPSESNFYRQILLFSDGRATDGMVDQDGLAALARETREAHNIHFNTVAIGEDADLDLMAGMAKQGWGFAATLNDSSVAGRVSTRRQLDLVRKAANSTELRIKVGPTVNLVEVLGADAAVQGNLARIPVGELGPAEVFRVVLHLSTENVGKEVRPIELAQVELQYEDALTERKRNQSLTVTAELNPAKAKGREALDVNTLRYAALELVKRHTARAEEAAADGDQAGARDMLEQTRESLKQLAGLGRLEIAGAMELLDKRTTEIAGAKASAPADKKKKNKKKKKH